MLTTLLLTSLIIAGFIVVFTQLREETSLGRIVEKLPFPFSHAVGCPFCLSYWLALLAAILIEPFAGWQVPWRAFAADAAWLELLLCVIGGWFAIGFLANCWRVLYMLVGKDMSLADLEAKELKKELSE